MKFGTLHSLFIHELEDAYSAEHQIKKALPGLAEKAESADLKEAFENHLLQTSQHVLRLEEVFSLIEHTPTKHTCQAIAGILKEGEELLANQFENGIKDLALIVSALRVEYYEQTLYGSLVEMAHVMEHTEAADLLEETLDEEEGAADTLDDIAAEFYHAVPLGHDL